MEDEVVERATRKMCLGGAATQQGQLMAQITSLSKNELMAMAKFGAETIFNAKGDGTSTSQGINATRSSRSTVAPAQILKPGGASR